MEILRRNWVYKVPSKFLEKAKNSRLRTDFGYAQIFAITQHNALV